MARATVRLFESLHNGDNLNLEDASWSGTANKAIYRDKTSGDRLVLEGTHLKYDHGDLSGGKVNGFSVVDADGSKFYGVEDVKLSASLFAGEDFFAQLDDIFVKIFKNDTRVIGTNMPDDVIGGEGNDLLLGRRGEDWLNGGTGKDILTGGVGVDHFIFEKGWGRDAVTDFDANGGAGMQDFVDTNFNNVLSITRSGKNTVIDLGDGDTLTLLDVRPSMIDQTDFLD